MVERLGGDRMTNEEAIKKDGLKLMEEKMLRGDANDKITE